MKDNQDKEIVCEEQFKQQCVSGYGTKACKLRYFNKKCMMALKQKSQEPKVSKCIIK